MALGACCGTCWLTGPFPFSMAFGAQLVHYKFLLELAVRLELLDDAGLLRKHRVAYFAVIKLCLVPAVGKRDIASCAAVQLNFFSALVFGCGWSGNPGPECHSGEQYQDEQKLDSHNSLSLFPDLYLNICSTISRCDYLD